jgi:hypothetical protein
MPSAFDRWKDAARERKTARERPFPQFTLRTMLLVTSLCAIALGVLRRWPIRLRAEDVAFLAALATGVVLAFVVAVLRQNRGMLVWGSIGGMIGAVFFPTVDVHWGSHWQRFLVAFPFSVVPTLIGTFIGLAVARWLAQYENWRRSRWRESREARVRHGAMPRELDLSQGEDSNTIPPEGP